MKKEKLEYVGACFAHFEHGFACCVVVVRGFDDLDLLWMACCELFGYGLFALDSGKDEVCKTFADASFNHLFGVCVGRRCNGYNDALA